MIQNTITIQGWGLVLATILGFLVVLVGILIDDHIKSQIAKYEYERVTRDKKD